MRRPVVANSPSVSNLPKDSALIIELIGKRDSPTDGVADYSRLLNSALEARGIAAGLGRVRWDEIGRIQSLWELWATARNWKGQWALMHYTALMWSSRGFPLLFLFVLSVLKVRKAHVAVVFHDPEPYRGKRYLDRLRGGLQHFVMGCAYRLSERSIFNVPPERVSWLRLPSGKASFVPIGANLPVAQHERNGCEVKTIAVFTITDGGDISKEVSDIVCAARKAAERFRVQLLTVGRGSLESESRFRQALEGSTVEYAALGILSAEEVSQVLAKADVSLFVRGLLSTQRGSAIASIANGVPLVGYADSLLPAALAEAGVVGVRYADADALAQATVRVLADRQLWKELHERSRYAYQKYFSWDAIATRLLEVLQHA